MAVDEAAVTVLPLAVLEEHSRAVLAVAARPTAIGATDRDVLASGGADHDVLVYSAESGKVLAVLGIAAGGHSDNVTAVAFDHKGAFLVSGSADATVKIWAADAPYSLLHTLKIASGVEVTSVAFCSHGKLLAVGAKDGGISLYNVTGWAQLHRLSGHTAAVCALTSGPSGLLVSGAQDGVVRVWDTKKLVCVFSAEDNDGQVLAVQFAPDYGTLVSGGKDAQLRVYDVWGSPTVSLSLTHTLSAHKSSIWSAVFSRGGEVCVTASQDTTVMVWDAESWRRVRVIRAHARPVFALAFSTSGRRFVSASADCTLGLFSASDVTAISSRSDSRGRHSSRSPRPSEGGAGGFSRGRAPRRTPPSAPGASGPGSVGSTGSGGGRVPPPEGRTRRRSLERVRQGIASAANSLGIGGRDARTLDATDAAAAAAAAYAASGGAGSSLEDRDDEGSPATVTTQQHVLAPPLTSSAPAFFASLPAALRQYESTFAAEGFDTTESIALVDESDLVDLIPKQGHRKLFCSMLFRAFGSVSLGGDREIGTHAIRPRAFGLVELRTININHEGRPRAVRFFSDDSTEAIERAIAAAVCMEPGSFALATTDGATCTVSAHLPDGATYFVAPWAAE